MVRRAALAAMLLAGAALAQPDLAQPSTAKPAGAARPNIVLIIVDDWGYSDVGAFGSEIATPNIDALARAGTRLANFHVAGSCSPTRAMLLTGMNSHRAGLGNMPETIPPAHVGKPGYDAVLARGIPTLANRLHDAGYATLFAGKWHLGRGATDREPGNLPGNRGWEQALALSQSGADNFENTPNKLLYETADWTQNGQPAALPERFYSSTLITDTAIRQMASVKGRPFFATLGYLSNHIPLQAPDADLARYQGRYEAGWSALRDSRAAGTVKAGVLPASPHVTMASTRDWQALTPQERARWSGAMTVYAAMATALDREIGRLVSHLKASGQYDNTVFVFVSDNGAEASNPEANWFTTANTRAMYDMAPANQGRPGSFTYIGASWASAAASPLKGYKFSASEGGLRVPFIIAAPGRTDWQPGRVAHGFAYATDLAPTLLDLAGVSAGDGLEGRSLVPMLAGTGSAHRADEAIGYELSGNAVLFKGDFKLVKNLPPYGDGRWHVFDIMADPGETRDLGPAQPALLAAMKGDYARWAAANKVLAMPDGYSAPQQIQDNALRHLLPRRLAPLAGALLALLLVWGTMRGWRRAA